MISVAYVNGYHDRILTTDTSEIFEQAISSILSEVDEANDNYLNTYNRIMFESSIDGMTDEMNESLYVESSNVFEKIGEAIIKMVKTVKEYLAKMIAKLSSFEKKSDLEKISAAVKKNPEIGDSLVEAFNSGKLTVYDAKSIKEIEDNYMELIKLAKNKDVSPDTLKGKFEGFKKKCEEVDKSALVNVAKATGATITGVMSIFLIKKTLNEIKKSSSDALSSNAKASDAMIDALHEMQSSADSNIQKGLNPNLGKAQILKNIESYMCNRYENIVTKNEESHNRITDALRKTLEKIDRKGIVTSKINDKEKAKKKADVKAAKEFIKGASEKYDIRNPKTDRDEERRKNRQDAADRAYGTEKGRRDYEGKHYQKVSADIITKAEYQQRGRDNAIDLDLEREKAKAQAKGREDGTTPKKPGVQKIEIVRNNKKNDQTSKK